MRTFTFIILITASSLFACKNSSQAMGADKIVPSNSGKNNTKTSNDIVYDIIISFISKGEGIDNKLQKNIDTIIVKFNQDNNTNIKPIKIGWGREGEVDYNFISKNLSTSQKKSFVSQIKEAIGTSDMVHLSFNKKAVHKR